MGIVDAQSVKNTDTAREKGYDAGKKVSGIKRHIAVDTNGLPHAIEVTTANVTDRDGAILLAKNSKENLSAVLKLLVDGGYSGKKFAQKIKQILGAEVEVVKRSELHTFKVIPKRWVVERSFAWLEKCRRLWKNCERKLETSRQMIILAFISLLMRRV
jgi:transposase